MLAQEGVEPGSGPELRLLLTVKQTGAALSLGLTRTYDLLRSGAIPSVKVGGRRMVRVGDLVRYVDSLPPEAGPVRRSRSGAR